VDDKIFWKGTVGAQSEKVNEWWKVVTKMWRSMSSQIRRTRKASRAHSNAERR